MSRTPLALTFAAALVLLGFTLRPSPADDAVRVNAPAASLMQRKLDLSQNVLKALALEDYPLMSKSTTELLQLARQHWTEEETPAYRAQLKDFWTVLEGLDRAAQDKNLDGATLAYVQLTISCVKCHKSLRMDVE